MDSMTLPEAIKEYRDEILPYMKCTRQGEMISLLLSAAEKWNAYQKIQNVKAERVDTTTWQGWKFVFAVEDKHDT